MVAGAKVTNPTEWGLRGAELAIDPERWVEERQYSRCDGAAALEAFRRRRRDSLDLFGRLHPEQWQRGCQHPTLGRVAFADWTGLMAAHDDNHLAQATRAVMGKP
jgi:DinB superfamily